MNWKRIAGGLAFISSFDALFWLASLGAIFGLGAGFPGAGGPFGMALGAGALALGSGLAVTLIILPLFAGAISGYGTAHPGAQGVLAVAPERMVVGITTAVLGYNATNGAVGGSGILAIIVSTSVAVLIVYGLIGFLGGRIGNFFYYRRNRSRAGTA